VGAPSAHFIWGPFEDGNPFIHSINDTSTAGNFSVSHIQQFSKAALGFVVELAGINER
jgi:hypothetical protein